MRPAVVTTKLSTFTARFSTRTRRRHLSGVHAQRERSIGAGSNQCGGARLPPPPVSRRGQPLWLRAPHGTKSFVNLPKPRGEFRIDQGCVDEALPVDPRKGMAWVRAHQVGSLLSDFGE